MEGVFSIAATPKKKREPHRGDRVHGYNPNWTVRSVISSFTIPLGHHLIASRRLAPLKSIIFGGETVTLQETQDGLSIISLSSPAQLKVTTLQ